MATDDDIVAFDFEQNINKEESKRRPNAPTTSASPAEVAICRHWLRGICSNGEACEFLHQFSDTPKSRGGICRQWELSGHCPDIARCPYAHSGSTPACVHYFLGFCSAGSRCKLRHDVRPPSDLPPLVPDWYLHLVLEDVWSLIPNSMDPETQALMDKVEAQCRAVAGSGGGGGGGGAGSGSAGLGPGPGSGPGPAGPAGPAGPTGPATYNKATPSTNRNNKSPS